MKILLVEDEVKVNNFIYKGLEEEGYSVDVAFDGATGLDMAFSSAYDLIILDILLPGLNGLEICNRIRKFDSSVPILILTALGSLEEKINGLNAGADDYLPKPFHFQELLARIRALGRRKNLEMTSSEELKINDLIINIDAKTVQREGKNISLTLREFQMLELFVRNKGRVLSRAFISEKIWEHSFDTGSNVIDVYVNYLRKKIDDGFKKKLIHTVIGMGYVLRD